MNEVPPDNADGLSIAPLNTNPSMGNIDWGGSIAQAGSITFPISNKGIVNRDPSQVTSDEKIYCFQGENNMNGSPISIIIQLETNTLLKAEYLQEACPMNPQFHSPTSYIR